MTDTIAEIRARHAEVTANWMHGYFDRDGVQAHADRAVLLARVAELMAERDRMREALVRMLLEFDFLVEGGHLPDVRGDIIFVEARAALGEQT